MQGKPLDPELQDQPDKMPNAATREAIAELEVGKGARFESVEALMADLHGDVPRRGLSR